ncbi:MAG: type II toxin-antitoxin system RelE/ParE family toxin [Candidatus Kapabacteria bacterium]|nr:type II toxin-antitoxin system RelE/ParE family toxin [Candidatus Kapabacteria bacterium]
MNSNFYQYDFADYMGKIEMNEFLDSLDKKESAKIIAYMDKLVELLNINQFPNEKLSKYLRDGIFELRVNLKNKISRSLYFFMSDKNIIFTHGFIKKVEKTPNSEIEKAIKFKKYYRSKK